MRTYVVLVEDGGATGVHHLELRDIIHLRVDDDPLRAQRVSASAKMRGLGAGTYEIFLLVVLMTLKWA